MKKFMLVAFASFIVYWIVKPTDSPRLAVAAVAAPVAVPQCLATSAIVVSDIRELLNINGAYSILRTAAVRSTDHRNAHLVAVTFSASGINSQALVFLVSGSLDSPGMYFAGDVITAEFSVVRRARDTKAGLVRGTQSYYNVLRCIGA